MKEYIIDGNEHFTVANFKGWDWEMFSKQYKGNIRADLPTVWEKIQAELNKEANGTESDNETAKQTTEDLTDKGTDEGAVSKQRVSGSRNRSKHAGSAIQPGD